MTFDPAQLAKLAAFAETLGAPKGQSYDDIQQQRETDKEALRELIKKQIEEIDEKIVEGRERARQEALRHEAFLSETRRAILDNNKLSPSEKSYALRDLRHGYISPGELFDREVRRSSHLQRKKLNLQHELDELS